MEFLPQKIDKYSVSHCTEPSNILKKITRQTNLKIPRPRMLSGHLQGNFLGMITGMIRPRNILEIGTYTGYSAIAMLEGIGGNATGTKLYTIDCNEELEDRTRDFFREAGVEKNIEYIIGDAVEEIEKINAKFDLVFIDADKINYSTYYDLVFDKVPIGGYILADNVLWSGKVVEEEIDLTTQAILDFNKKVHDDLRVVNTLLPLRDGIMMLKKIAK